MKNRPLNLLGFQATFSERFSSDEALNAQPEKKIR